jgi:hypothetical protein
VIGRCCAYEHHATPRRRDLVMPPLAVLDRPALLLKLHDQLFDVSWSGLASLHGSPRLVVKLCIMTELEAAWLAGLIEGEGTFTLCWNHPRTRKSGWWQATITVYGNDRDVIERAADLMNGKLYSRGPRHQEAIPNRKQGYYARCHRRVEVARVIEAILPWLGERRKAKALTLLKHLRPHS